MHPFFVPIHCRPLQKGVTKKGREEEGTEEREKEIDKNSLITEFI